MKGAMSKGVQTEKSKMRWRGKETKKKKTEIEKGERRRGDYAKGVKRSAEESART